MQKIFNWMILHLTHRLLAQFKGWRLEALCPATSQLTGLFDQVNFEFLRFFFSMDAKSNSKALKMPSPYKERDPGWGDWLKFKGVKGTKSRGTKTFPVAFFAPFLFVFFVSLHSVNRSFTLSLRVEKATEPG